MFCRCMLEKFLEQCLPKNFIVPHISFIPNASYCKLMYFFFNFYILFSGFGLKVSISVSNLGTMLELHMFLSVNYSSMTSNAKNA